jgi:CheY-like chemotaxis protein
MTCTGRGAVKATILVVDDSPEMQRYLRTLLELDRYRVIVASSGDQALEILRYPAVADVVLLDVQMPGKDGLQVLRRMREFCPKVKVIMCSGVDDPGKVYEALALGAHAYLVKPIQHLYLSAAVERCLQTAPATRLRQPGKPRLFVLPSPVRAEQVTLLPNFKS